MGIIAGALLGAVAGAIKYFLIWRPALKEKDSEKANKGVLHRLGIGYFINVATLLAVFFLRKSLPFSFEATAISAAIVLSITARLCPMTEILKQSDRA